jgi:hypothetical protein
MFDSPPAVNPGSQAKIKKSDAELQICWAEVWVPGIPDVFGDVMSADEVRGMAHRFMRSGRLGAVDLEHDNLIRSAHVVESFIARDNDPDFIPGSWVVGVHVEDPNLWAMIKAGEINGFSMEAWAYRQPVEIALEIPEGGVSGWTEEREGHQHRFLVLFDDEGRFVGGSTDEVDGHRHHYRGRERARTPVFRGR